MKPKYPTRQHPGIIVLAFAVVGLSPLGTQSAHAADYTWDGDGGDNNWGTGANWNPDGAPAPAATNSIHFAGTTQLTSNNNYTAFDDFQNILFDSGAGSFTVSGNAIDLFGNVTNNSANAQALNINLALQNGSQSFNATSGDLSIGGADVFTNGNNLGLSAASGKALTVSALISMGGGVSVTGPGTVTLSNTANTYTGATTITSGVLSIGQVANGGSNSSIGASSNAAANLVIGSSGTLQFTGSGLQLTDRSFTVSAGSTFDISNSSGNLVFTGANSGAVTINKIGSGILTLGGTTDNVGLGVSITNGTVVLGKTSTSAIHALGGNASVGSGGLLKLGGSGGDQIFNSATVTVASGGAFDVADQSESVGILSLAGTGIGGAGALLNSGTGSSTLTPSSTTLTGNTTIGVTNSSGNLTLANVVSGTGFSLTKVGAGTLILGGANTYTGGTTVSAGTLQINQTTSAAATGSFTLGGGTLRISQAGNNFGYNSTIGLTADSTFSNAGAGAINYTGTITGNGNALTVNNTGNRLYINGTVSGVTQFNVTAGAMGMDLGGGNSVGGAPIIVSNGAALWVVNSAVTSTNNITLNGGTGSGGTGALFQENSATLSTLSGTVTLNSTSSVGVANAGGTILLTGKVTGTGGLTKIGAGTLTLANSTNDYSGTTTITAGTLRLGNGGTTGSILSSGTISIAAAGTLSINRSNAVAQGTDFGVISSTTGSLTKAGAGTLTLSGSNAISTLNVNNATGMVDLGIGGNLTINNGGGNTIQSTTGGAITGGTITLGASDGDTGTASGTTLTINSKITSGAGVRLEYWNGNVANTGTLVLTNAANDFTGGVAINTAGTISVSTINNTGSAGNLGTGGTVTLATNGATLKYTGAGETTNRTITMGGGANAGGTIDASGGGTALKLSSVTNTNSANGTATLTLTGSGLGEITGTLANQNGSRFTAVTKAGAGTWTLSGANSYTGTTTVTGGGTLIASGVGSTNTGTYTVTTGTLRGTNSHAFGDTTNISIGGSGILDLRGDANATFGKTTGGAAYTVSTSATGATVNVDQNTVAGTNQIFTLGAFTVGSAAATANTVFTGANNTSLILGAVTDTTATSGTTSFTNNISGGGSLSLASFAGTRTTAPTLLFNGSGNTIVSGAITQTGTQALTYSGAGTLTLNGTNTYTGATNLNGGALQLANANAIASSSGLTMATGTTLQLRADADTTFATSGTITLTSDTTTGVDTTSFNFDVNAATAASNKTLTLGAVQFSPTGGNRGQDQATVNVTGASGYTLALGAVKATTQGQIGANHIFNVASGLNLTMTSILGQIGSVFTFSGAGNTTTGALNRVTNRAFDLKFNQTGTVTLNSAAVDGGGSSSFSTALNAGTTVFNNASAVNGVQINLGNQTAASTADANFLLGGSTGLNGGLSFGSPVRAYDTTSGLLSLGGQNTSNTNTYSNTITLGNTLNTGKSVNLVAAAGGTVSFTGVIAKNGTDTTAGVTINGAYTVNGSTVNPTGSVKLAGANTYGGVTTLAGGTLISAPTLTGNSVLGSSSALTFTGGTLQYGNAFSVAAGNALGDYSAKIKNSTSAISIDTLSQNVTYASVLDASNTGGLTKLNTGSLMLSAANAYTGNTTIAAGSLVIGGAGQLGSGSYAGDIANAGNFNYASSAAQTLSGVISGTGALNQNGAGTLTLTGNNTYTGLTTVSAGKLVVNGSFTSTITSVASGATLGGSGGSLSGATTIDNGGHLAAGDGTAGSVGTLTFSNNLTFAGSIFDWDLNGATGELGTADQGTYDKIVASGGSGSMSGTSIFNVVLGTGSFADTFWNSTHTWSDVFSGSGVSNLASIFTTYSGTDVNPDGTVTGRGGFTFTGPTGSTLTWSAVPEPTSALAGLLIGAGLLRRRRCPRPGDLSPPRRQPRPHAGVGPRPGAHHLEHLPVGHDL